MVVNRVSKYTGTDAVIPKFQKGTSGNPSGRKPGASRAAKLLEAIESDIPEIIKSLAKAAKSGDVSAAKLLLDRSVPTLKPLTPATEIQGLREVSLIDRGTSVVNALADGEIAPEQAQSILQSLASLARIQELDDIEKRLTELEKLNK